MSGTPAFTYEIIRNGKQPQMVEVLHKGILQTYSFGTDVSERRIIEMLPRLVMDFRFKVTKRAV
ncbi:hypothetical protein LC085_07675 [Bacillus tianshenii]|uniref:hypothetical protein n=1 Tax=Sutcliffiella tianshenii TaxID=1463404 RepID=UPI001CD47071|nr:hypothetical protein [Bacillus tianshenii]MCA1319791.1 hypothetical protein [Bacillus tianshenii]